MPTAAALDVSQLKFLCAGQCANDEAMQLFTEEIIKMNLFQIASNIHKYCTCCNIQKLDIALSRYLELWTNENYLEGLQWLRTFMAYNLWQQKPKSQVNHPISNHRINWLTRLYNHAFVNSQLNKESSPLIVFHLIQVMFFKDCSHRVAHSLDFKYIKWVEGHHPNLWFRMNIYCQSLNNIK